MDSERFGMEVLQASEEIGLEQWIQQIAINHLKNVSELKSLETGMYEHLVTCCMLLLL
jgi:hypothetical protein